ncbi:ENTH-domain-containing protein [Trichodelitschia bisporula]|uniref:ENTH-domain-containing protein n=1 Tax=Trichodelitschia bisporula TaxID=703511 RepID=A0A6G1I7R4_9PEZI|nr:ENTH-domain-containing protein [Trichodelitschia bisporula]
MDFDSLKTTISGLTLYDVKAGVRKVQNAVMNYTEMEAKVREATNNEPWGASSTAMQEIANGTFNYQLLGEIMPMIYKRFTEKAAEEWRQIYKALQLLEFLVKHGSERVIDDARSHISLLKMLRQFHFIDQNGKDQGINVRNRSKELVELLGDVERIRAERKKARGNRNKYQGYEGGSGLGSGMSAGSSRFGGGYGNDSGSAGYGAYNGGVFGDGGGFGGSSSSDYQDSGRRDRFEEYDEYDEGASPAGSKAKSPPPSPSARRSAATMASKKPEPPKAKQPEVDLFSFDDPAPAPTVSSSKAPLAALDAGDDDDFDDFVAAPAPAAPAASSAAAFKPASAFHIPPPATTSTTTASTLFAAPKPVSGTQGQNFTDLFATVSPPLQAGSSISSPPAAAPAASLFAPLQVTPAGGSAFKPPTGATGLGQKPIAAPQTQPNYYTSVAAQPTRTASVTSSTPTTLASLGKPTSTTGTKSSSSGDAFAGLLSGVSSKKPTQTQAQKVTMADMARQKASAGIWGVPAAGSGAGGSSSATGAAKPKVGGGLEDLLG